MKVIVTELVAMALLILGMFGDVILLPGDIILSNANADVASQFVHWRSFGFGELAKGNLALWNPHIFSGAPYFAGFQSALLYPPNWLYLILPLARSINVGIALHVFLGGAFFYAWAYSRKLHHLACFLGAVIFMLCGPHFSHIYSGHLPNLCTLVWVPILFLCVDKMHVSKDLRWPLLGAFAVAMQILAGHVQYVYYTAIAGSLYASVLLLRTPGRVRFAASFLFCYVGGAMLAAVQLLPGLGASSESLRGSGVSIDFASMFSFAPENFITWFVPGFFGDMTSLSYWGRCYLWEMSLFISVTGIALAAYAIAFGGKRPRFELLLPAGLLMLLALGSHTPWFPLLYEYLPGFDKFRGTSKFTLQATIFLIMLSSIGLDLILKEGLRRYKAVRLVMSGTALAGLILAIGVYFSASSEGLWTGFMQGVLGTGEVQGFEQYSMRFMEAAGSFASQGLAVFALTSLLICGIAAAVHRRKHFGYLLVILALVELTVVARGSRDTFRLSAVLPEGLSSFFRTHGADFRVLMPDRHNLSMSYSALDIWGYDPSVLRRYAELVASSQGLPVKEVAQYISFRQYNKPLFDLLRCKYGITFKKDGANVFEFSTQVMPRLSIIHKWLLLEDRDRILKFMTNSFNPRETVILEKDPQLPQDGSNSRGQAGVSILDSSTDHLTVEAELSQPGVLLLTDAYSEGWRAKPLKGSAQTFYQVVPADYAFMGVPLQAGKHKIRIEYLPAEFVVGKWISIVSLSLYIAAIFCVRFRRRPPQV